MTLLQYISYNSRLSEDEQLIRDRQISRDRKEFLSFKNVKKVIVGILVGGAMYFGVKNLPLQQTAVNKFESDVLEIIPISSMDENSSPDLTPTSSFESDVLEIIPISPIDENSSPDLTPTSSFESDVMGITTIDNSQLDNP